MVTCYMICRDKNDDYYHKGREGGGQRVMIEIIISENDDNDGWPLRVKGRTNLFQAGPQDEGMGDLNSFAHAKGGGPEKNWQQAITNRWPPSQYKNDSSLSPFSI